MYTSASPPSFPRPVCLPTAGQGYELQAIGAVIILVAWVDELRRRRMAR